MNFGSRYVYNNVESDEEFVSDEELERGIDDIEANELGLPSDPVYDNPAPPPPPALPAPRGGGPAYLSSGRGGRLASDPVPRRPPAKSKKSHWMQQDLRQSYIQRQQKEGKGKKWRRADTNVVTITFDKLKDPSCMFTGDPVECGACKAVLSAVSKIEKQSDSEDEQKWVCEFCGEDNRIELMDEEIPKDKDVTYMLEPALSTAESGKNGKDESLVIFCVDTSGSMCVTTEVKGKIKLRGDRLNNLQSLNDTHESQWMPGQSRNVTYISRLQCVQAAVDHQLHQLVEEHPNRRVSLVTFSSDVSVVGDGTALPVNVSGDKLHDIEELKNIGGTLPLPNAVASSKKDLSDKLFDLEERGQTALGPALVIAISQACKVPGSKVIICTDGKANVGVGNLDATADEQDAYSLANQFFTSASELAKESGVAVSVISIQGSDCKLVELGKVAQETGGQVNIVDPLKLTQQFGSIIADPVIATKVTATFQLHKLLFIRGDEDDEEERSVVERYVGNVTKDTDISFEFGVRKKPAPKTEDIYDNAKRDETYDNAKKDDNYDNAGPSGATAGTSGATAPQVQITPALEDLKEVPFQLRVVYTDTEGAKALRVLTQTKPLTVNREEAEEDMDIRTVGQHATKMQSAHALEGAYTTSRMVSNMYNRMMFRHATKSEDSRVKHDYLNVHKKVRKVENDLAQQQCKERASKGHTRSDSEGSDDEEEETDALRAEPSPYLLSAPPAPGKMSKPKKKKAHKRYLSRRQEMDDCLAEDLYEAPRLLSEPPPSLKPLTDAASGASASAPKSHDGKL